MGAKSDSSSFCIIGGALDVEAVGIIEASGSTPPIKSVAKLLVNFTVSHHISLCSDFLEGTGLPLGDTSYTIDKSQKLDIHT